MKRYNPVEIEQKWQAIWQAENTYKAIDFDETRPKAYCAEMFPYPSGVGLHVGHVRNFTIVDVLARYYRQRGYNVLRPIGWDAFGLPAENYALKTGIAPQITTKDNIANFKKQYMRLGMAVDFSREINTTHPEYYRWTQWVFTKLFEHGLAYRKESYQWWCPVDKTVLANEQVEGGKCWRCGSTVFKKKLNQWFFKITDYADDLLDSIDELDWPKKIKTMQRNWIGRSEGAEILFDVAGSEAKLEVFTTRPDTLMGASFIVLAPEHELVSKITSAEQQSEVSAYCESAMQKSELERKENKVKTGVFTGAYALHPITKEQIPIWISDYVLIDYGSGAIMAVPAHDERDKEFASKFGLPIIKVINEDNKLINSGRYDGLEADEAKKVITDDLAKSGIGKAKVTYKMRDWLISRQRYWGAPIPIVHCQACGDVTVPEDQLPIRLPEIDNYAPADDGRSPLAKLDDFVKTICPKCGGAAERETDTMDGYACSSWYLLRYTDARNTDQAWSKELANYWCPVDFYVGGDHAVAHLLYVRFWTKFFNKLGLVDFNEPVKRLLYNGYINAPDGSKMSKSKGNVIDPLEVINSGYGADTLRTYEMFIGPYNMDAMWNTNSIGGVYKFLTRIWNLVQEYKDSKKDSVLTNELKAELNYAKNLVIKKVSDDMSKANFNTAVASLMEYLNELYKAKEAGFDESIWHSNLVVFCQLLAPFAPHIANEMLSEISGQEARIENIKWPIHNEAALVKANVTVVVQVNGKMRGNITVAKGSVKYEVERQAFEVENVAKFIDGKEIVKTIYIEDKLLNIVVK